MQSPKSDIIEEFLHGSIIDPCDYDAYSLEKLNEFLGDNEEE